MTELNLGPDDMMAICAFRYCLGRKTYVSSECANWLVEQWGNLSERAKFIIRRDLEEAFSRDEKEGEKYKRLGDDCDKAEWMRVRKLWEMSL